MINFENNLAGIQKTKTNAIRYLESEHGISIGTLLFLTEDVSGLPIWPHSSEELKTVLLEDRKSDNELLAGKIRHQLLKKDSILCFVDVFTYKQNSDPNEAWDIWYGFLSQSLFYVDILHFSMTLLPKLSPVNCSHG